MGCRRRRHSLREWSSFGWRRVEISVAVTIIKESLFPRLSRADHLFGVVDAVQRIVGVGLDCGKSLVASDRRNSDGLRFNVSIVITRSVIVIQF